MGWFTLVLYSFPFTPSYYLVAWNIDVMHRSSIAISDHELSVESNAIDDGTEKKKESGSPRTM